MVVSLPKARSEESRHRHRSLISRVAAPSLGAVWLVPKALGDRCRRRRRLSPPPDPSLTPSVAVTAAATRAHRHLHFAATAPDTRYLADRTGQREESKAMTHACWLLLLSQLYRPRHQPTPPLAVPVAFFPRNHHNRHRRRRLLLANTSASQRDALMKRGQRHRIRWAPWQQSPSRSPK